MRQDNIIWTIGGLIVGLFLGLILGASAGMPILAGIAFAAVGGFIGLAAAPSTTGTKTDAQFGN